MTRFIRLSDWTPIRDHFTQAERDALNAAMVSQVICPRGGVVDMGTLSPELVEKLNRELPKEKA